MTFKKTVLLVTSLVTLAACGGSSEDAPVVVQAEPNFSFAISDAPVDDVSEVVVCFNAVELKHAGSADNDQLFTVGVDPQALAENDLCKDANGNTVAETRGINLLAFTGDDSEQLISSVTIAQGTYNQLRVAIGEGSYATLKESGEKIAIRVPSNELKLDGFSAALGDNLNFTLEFDLRKAMTNPVGQDNYILKPRGVRLVDNSQIGHIEGTVSETIFLNNESCEVAPNDNTNVVAAVYIFEGQSLTLETLADNGGSEGIEALASAPVLFDGAATYSYEIGFVSAGDYTLALTCDTVDDPEADDEVAFLQTIEISLVQRDEPQTANFE